MDVNGNYSMFVKQHVHTLERMLVQGKYVIVTKHWTKSKIAHIESKNCRYIDLLWNLIHIWSIFSKVKDSSPLRTYLHMYVYIITYALKLTCQKDSWKVGSLPRLPARLASPYLIPPRSPAPPLQRIHEDLGLRCFCRLEVLKVLSVLAWRLDVFSFWKIAGIAE